MNRHSSALLAACALATPLLARADFKTWTGGAAGTATSWSDPNNWSPVGVPAPGDNVNVYGLSTVSPIVNYDYAPALIFAAVTVNHSNPDVDQRERTTTLNISSFDLSTAFESIGNGGRGRGTVNQSGAVNTVTGSSPLFMGVNKLNIGPDVGTYNLSGGTLTSAAGLIVGVSGQGFFNQSGGRVSLAPGGSLVLGQNVGALGQYNFSAGTLTAGSLIAGASGMGTITQTGGSSSFSTVLLGDAAGSAGAYNFSGGILACTALVVGNAANGSFNMTGGALNTGSFHVGYASGSAGTAAISNSFVVTGSTIIGNSGAGILNIGTGSTFRIANTAIIGASSGSTGHVTVGANSQVLLQNGGTIGLTPTSHGTITLNGANAALRPLNPAPAPPFGTLTIGASGVGVLNLFNGAVCERFVRTILGEDSGSQGFVNVDGPASSWNPGILDIGLHGNAAVNLTGGTITSTEAVLGFFFGSRGTATLSGANSVWDAGNAFVGWGGAGTLSIASSAHFITSALRYGGGGPAPTGLVQVDGPGSLLTVNGNITFTGAGGAGTLLLTNNGTATINGDIVDTSGISTITLDGGSLNLQGFTIGPTNPIDNLNLRAGTLMNVGQINAGATGLIKTGPGTLALPTANTYTGGTFVQQGTLIIAHQTALNSGNLNLSAGARAVLQLGPAGAAHFINLAIAGSTNNWTAQLDLTSSALLFTTATPTKAGVINQFRNQIATAFNAGTWTGNGITSSTILTSPGTFLALVDNADLHLTSFRGIPTTDNDLILVQAHLADANLDNKVDAIDLNILAAHWQQQQNALWSAGDFTNDGKVDALDLNLLASNWQSGVPLIPSFYPLTFELLTSSSPIPEPASLTLLSLSAIPLLTRRRRN